MQPATIQNFRDGTGSSDDGLLVHIRHTFPFAFWSGLREQEKQVPGSNRMVYVNIVRFALEPKNLWEYEAVLCF
jgi:hypothetical protein